MIFVTVGGQLPFDRLVKAMDKWAGHNKEIDVFAQISKTSFVPSHMGYAASLDADAFRKKCEAADIIISHAGIGNILLARELQKPIIVVPRRAELKEHRNDHQMATVKWLESTMGIRVVYDVTQLGAAIGMIGDLHSNGAASPYASQELLDALSHFIHD